MPIKILNDLPAKKILTGENIFVMTESSALKQDIRPLKILLLNLMPKKITTETPVSYTHLDVYQRQQWDKALSSILRLRLRTQAPH